MSSLRMILSSLTVASALLVTASAPAEAAAKPPEGLKPYAIGYEFPGRLSDITPESPAPIPDPNASEENPIPWRIEVFWAEIEHQKGEYDWSAVSEVVDRFRAANHEPILCLWGGNPNYSEDLFSPPTVQNQQALAGWEGFVRSAGRTFRGKVRWYEIWRTPNVPGLWPGTDALKQYAFLLKRTSTVLRGEAGSSTGILAGGLFGGDAAFVRGLFAEGVGPYVDVVAVRPDPQRDVATQITSVAATLAEISPGTKLWAMGLPALGDTPEIAIAGMARQTLIAFGAGATVATFNVGRPGPQGWPLRVDGVVRLRSVLTPGLSLLPESRATFSSGEGAAPVASRTFYDADKGVAVVGWFADAAESERAVEIAARRPGPPLLYNPATGEQAQPPFEATAQGARGTVPVRPEPLFLLFREGVGQAAESTVEKGPEKLEVTAERGITAEEIITKHQEVAARQTARLRNYSADGMVQFHFGIAGGAQRIDVAMGGTFFYDPKTGPEWEFRDYYVNGNRSPWKSFPELPLIQPEKVVTLPLDISFDRTYSYTLVGEETVEGRACWILSFDPVDPEKSLYRGRVWIDKATFNKVRTAVTQTKLESPFISNEERDTYGPVEDDLWVLRRIDGQQIYSTAGRNFIVLREVTFQNLRINGDTFEQERQAAYDSNHQMLRETEKGFRYLQKDEQTGERKVKEGMDKSQLFGLAGVFYDDSRDYPLPLAGVNYFDYDLRGWGIQTNIFFAGALVSANATWPDFRKSGFDIGGDLYGFFVKSTDQGFESGRETVFSSTKPPKSVQASGEENDALDVDRRTQQVTFNLGHPIGNFAKARASVGLAKIDFGRTDDTYKDEHHLVPPGADREHFIVPVDTWEHSVELNGSYDRAGWSANATVVYAWRSDWPFWGCPSGTLANGKPRTCGREGVPVVSDWHPDNQDYRTYQFGGSKEWFLPAFQKMRAELAWFGGTDLDRFSQWQFAFFGGGTRLRGFSGSGVRYDEGIVGRATYSFNIANAVRFDATLDHGEVEDRSNGLGTTSHTGVGISGNFLAPWKTIVQFDFGYALQSDIEPAEGNFEALLVVLKLFD